MPLGEIAAASGLPPSTARRLLIQLTDAGFIQQDRDSGRYSLSLRFVQLGAVALETIDIVGLAQNVMRELTDRSQEAVFLGQLEPQGVVYLSVTQPSVPIRVSTRAGEIRPAHVTSIGKILLAHLSEEELDSWLTSHQLDARTSQALTTPESLKADLRLTRERGYSMNYQESSAEFASAAAPVRNHNGDVVAGLAISGPVYRISRDDLAELGEAVVDAARELSKLLGNVPTTNKTMRGSNVAS